MSTGDARAGILARINASLHRDDAARRLAAETVAVRLAAPVSANLIPARGQLGADDRVALFTRMAEGVAAVVRRLGSSTEVPSTVAGYLREHNLPQKLVMAPSPVLDRCGWETQPLLRVRRGTAVDDDRVGLTLAVAGIAETGTLLLASSPERPTLLAFMPETSIVVVAADAIDGAYEQAWDRLRATGMPPRSVNFVTGPSRTGDIAQKIELGAHGPKRLLILVVDRLLG